MIEDKDMQVGQVYRDPQDFVWLVTAKYEDPPGVDAIQIQWKGEHERWANSHSDSSERNVSD